METNNLEKILRKTVLAIQPNNTCMLKPLKGFEHFRLNDIG